ncbi:putative phosphohydrolase [Comamonas testosteroni TK102]|uniref:Putative phosphohydrolase n=2 Tax=Comamonas testosteroni TaxID=285 RepID=A0A076PVX8_COMTE|nr:putative phosphohydrolase [Comamonas testosteroni TK102]
MWPRLKNQLFHDLKSLHNDTGPWDLVIFSGDLTQQASKEEFSELTKTLKELWAEFNKLGSNPSLFVVPGNHDLTRPSEIDPSSIVLSQWWDVVGVQEDFWKSDSSKYRKSVETWFQNYVDWYDSLTGSIPLISVNRGTLPGDVSAVFEKEGIKLGIAGLNSSWLQHRGGNLEGQLCVHPRQLMSVMSNDPDKWCAENDFNLLVTHHPAEWLHSSSLNLWEAEINPPGRFDAHLFGHMHEGISKTVSVSGGLDRLTIQAASIFGLEHFGTNRERRDHGYSVINIYKKEESPVIRVWPRKLIKRSDNSAKLCANQEWNLVDDRYCDIAINKGISSLGNIKNEEKSDILVEVDSKDVLSRLTCPVTNINAHMAVRKAERAVFLAALKEKRMAWLVADWGQGGNEFVACVKHQLLDDAGDIFYLDLHKYRTTEDILAGVPEVLGCSFEKLCRDLAENGPGFVVLDDINIDLDTENSLSHKIHSFIKVILDFCPEISVIVLSRVQPAATEIRVVELSPLDEADTAQYIIAHERGGKRFSMYDAVSRLYRHTDGNPYRIDSALKDLQIVGLQGLHELDSDVSGKSVASRDMALPLKRAIDDLAESEDEACLRAYALLKVLSIFPQGEQFSRIRRFYGARAFYPNHVSLLLDRALIDAMDVTSLEVNSLINNNGKALVVRRPIREYIIQELSEEEHRELSEKALSLYFGESSTWEIRGITPPSYLKFEDSRCELREIGNATTMVLRAAKASIDSGDKKSMRRAIALATSYAASLKQGGHYRSISSLYDDFLPLFECDLEDLDISLAREQYAESLRMIGEHERARELFIQCEPMAVSNSRKQSVLLSLALCCESLSDYSEEAVEIAKRCEKIAPKTNSALQARSIIIANDPACEIDRDEKLEKLQALAIKRKSFVVANNIALDRAASVESSSERKSILNDVASIAKKESDAYNFIRSSLKLAKISLKENGQLSREQMSECTQAYSYIYNQRIDPLFSECHEILWNSFSNSGDIENLLNLFRHSSLIWRLRENVNKEKEYIERLFPLLGQKQNEGVLNANRGLLYFLTRSLEFSTSTPEVASAKSLLKQIDIDE